MKEVQGMVVRVTVKELSNFARKVKLPEVFEARALVRCRLRACPLARCTFAARFIPLPARNT